MFSSGEYVGGFGGRCPSSEEGNGGEESEDLGVIVGERGEGSGNRIVARSSSNVSTSRLGRWSSCGSWWRRDRDWGDGLAVGVDEGGIGRGAVATELED